MNNILILLILTVNFAFAQSKKSLNLKGGVKELHLSYYNDNEDEKSIAENSIYYFNREQNITKYDGDDGVNPIEIIYEYNKNGDLISSTLKKVYACESEERQVFKRDYKTNKSIEKHFLFNTNNEKGEELIKTIYREYENNLLKYKKESKEKVIEFFYTYSNNRIYNIKIIENTKIKNITYSYSKNKLEKLEKSGKDIISREIIEYNKYNLPIKSCLVNKEKDYNFLYIYKYRYDKKGNFTKKTTYRNGKIEGVEKRKIIYY